MGKIYRAMLDAWLFFSVKIKEKIHKVKREFKGIWIPKEIWLNKDLKTNEKLFLIEIYSLDNEDGCYANNKSRHCYGNKVCIERVRQYWILFKEMLVCLYLVKLCL